MDDDSGGLVNPVEFGTKALALACHYQNRFCEQQEVIEMFCLDAQAAQAPRQPLSVPAISHCINQGLGESGREQLRALARRVERQCALAWGVTLADGPQ